MSTTNLVVDKIPMNWFPIPEEKGGGKGKRIECYSLKNPKMPILYTIKTQHNPDHELSKKFDETIVKAILAMKEKRSDKIILKGVTTFYKVKSWVKPVSGCEVIVMSATKQILFREVVTGENKKVEEIQTSQENPDENPNLDPAQTPDQTPPGEEVLESKTFVDKIIEEAFSMDLDGGSVSA